MPPHARTLQEQVRRIAVLRAAQRALVHLVAREPLERSVAEVQVLRDQLRALELDADHAARTLGDCEARLSVLGEELRELLSEVPLRALCETTRMLGSQEPGTVRALGVLLLEGDLDEAWTLRAVEALVTALASEEAGGLRRVVKAPLDAFPELGRANIPALYEPHPDVAEAEQVLGREVRRLQGAQLDLDSVRDRIQRFKTRLGARVLHPTVLAATVAYNVAMGNRMAERLRAVDPRASEARLPVPEALHEEGPASEEPGAAVGASLVVVQETPARSKLLWQSLSVVAIAAGCLALAALLWNRRVDVVAPSVATTLSPYLVAGYVSEDDGVPRFFGTVSGDWRQLDAPERRRVVARIASRLAAEDVNSIILVDGLGALQARHEGESLDWVAATRAP